MRITGGTHRSRLLEAPKGTTTRPTSDRVREALFSMLVARGCVSGSRVLDLYAGTGALGLEALSRGATSATFVEPDRHALASLRANVTSLGEGDRTTVVTLRADRALAHLRGPFDLVLCDPPYADVKDAARVLSELTRHGTLDAACVLVLEHASRDEAPLVGGFELVDRRTYGDTALAIYELSPEANRV